MRIGSMRIGPIIEFKNLPTSSIRTDESTAISCRSSLDLKIIELAKSFGKISAYHENARISRDVKSKRKGRISENFLFCLKSLGLVLTNWPLLDISKACVAK
jgi:hypothetical protein